ncbi:MAG: hypothetical protein ACXAC8_06700 [Candidatus Hodarchaeales archaeon]|jgi:hypothetical protein
MDEPKKKTSPELSDKNSEEEPKEGLTEIANKVTRLKDQLKISNEVAIGIKEGLDRTYEQAKNSISLVGGSDEDVSKMWGYNFGGLIYDYLVRRDTIEGRQALSFIKLQLGYEMNMRIGGSEIYFASFVLGLSIRFIRGFEKLKENLNEVESAIKMFEERNYAHKTEEIERAKANLFGRERKE